MKKLLLFLMLLPLGIFASCSDKDEVPSADVTVTYDNVANVNGTLYAVYDTPVSVQSVTVKSTNGNATGMSGVTYVLDHNLLLSTIVEPFSVTIDPSIFLPGRHLLQMSFDILQVDKSIFSATISNVITVVETADQLPDGAVLGTYSDTYRISPE